jgi:hypothetical protein
MELIPIKAYETEPAAHIARTRLESLGIPCFIFNEYASLVPGVYRMGNGQIEIRVMEKDVEMASKILQSLEAPSELRCLECGSTELLEIPTSIWWHYLRLLLAGFAFIFPMNTRKFQCSICGLEFKRR